MKATEQYFPVVLFIMLYNVALTFESVNEILKCDHSKESYRALISYGTVYYAATAFPESLIFPSPGAREERPCCSPVTCIPGSGR